MSMSTHTPYLADCEAGLALSPIPIWVIDIETFHIEWANASGLDFWQASSVEELAGREMLANAPETVLVRLRQTLAKLHTGEPFAEDWTFFPRGKPRPVLLHLRAVVLRDGRIGMLNQAANVEEKSSAGILRAMAMMRHAKATIVFVDAQGTIFTQNEGSIFEFGQTNSWLNWIVDEHIARNTLRQALEGQTIRVEATVRTTRGERVHTILADELRDPVDGERGILIQHFDVTERVEAERLVQEHLATLRDQQREILALSTPFLDVGARTLALPLIGRIDEMRAGEITSRLLEMVASKGIERVILDITGVVSVDSASITFLRRLVDAIVLLGAKPIVTGIRSDLARMLAASDENLSGITIKRSLADGLAQGRTSGRA
jgi:rsbT co-antagonist protein RsbR